MTTELPDEQQVCIIYIVQAVITVHIMLHVFRKKRKYYSRFTVPTLISKKSIPAPINTRYVTYPSYTVVQLAMNVTN